MERPALLLVIAPYGEADHGRRHRDDGLGRTAEDFDRWIDRDQPVAGHRLPPIECGLLVNAAGLFADKIGAMAGDCRYTIYPCRGEYYLLDKIPGALHERTPLVFGSSEKVARIAEHHADSSHARIRSPLFGKRGLFRA